MGSVRKPPNIVFVKVPLREFPHEQGTLELAHGHQEIFVPTSQAPARVWLCFENFEGVQTCLGQINKVASYATHDGFVIIADINSEASAVKWIAEFV